MPLIHTASNEMHSQKASIFAGKAAKTKGYSQAGPIRYAHGMFELVNLDTDTVIAGRLRMCSTLSERLRGLLGTRKLDPDQAVWITPCNSIHTFFMLMSIDVAFLDAELRVIKIIPDMTPFRVCLPVSKAIGVIEGPVGMIKSAALKKGTRLEIRTPKSGPMGF